VSDIAMVIFRGAITVMKIMIVTTAITVFVGVMTVMKIEAPA
jgi:hypothetical protein